MAKSLRAAIWVTLGPGDSLGEMRRDRDGRTPFPDFVRMMIAPLLPKHREAKLPPMKAGLSLFALANPDRSREKPPCR